LINDLLHLNFQRFLGKDIYSTYSLGILLGIVAVALNLTTAVTAAVNAALACHLSLQIGQTRKRPNIEARLILCMIVLFGAAVISGGSLVLLSFNIDVSFAICVGVLFLSGVVIAIYHVYALFEAPGSSYLGLYDFSGFEGLKITIFLSVVSGFEAHGKKFCDILVQLSGFEDQFSKNLAS
jgi:hypothetical protein